MDPKEPLKITLLDWVARLVEEPKRFAAYKDDPEGVIKQDPDLLPRQKRVLLSRDPLRTVHAMAYEVDADPGTIAAHGIFHAVKSPSGS
jgi:hypothetical protein